MLTSTQGHEALNPGDVLLKRRVTFETVPVEMKSLCLEVRKLSLYGLGPMPKH
jgi:hypothetical protein